MKSAVVFVALWACLAGCATTRALPELKGGAEVALKRGGSWTTVTVKFPHAIGPNANLTWEGGQQGGPAAGRLVGTVNGGPVVLKFDTHSLSGRGPTGTVALELDDRPGIFTVAGTWNGSRVHLEMTPTALRGTITLLQGRTMLANVACQYVLDGREPGGARTGVSICTGMPEPTRLEFPATLEAALTKPAWMALLLVALSSPPLTASEASMGL